MEGGYFKKGKYHDEDDEDGVFTFNKEESKVMDWWLDTVDTGIDESKMNDWWWKAVKQKAASDWASTRWFWKLEADEKKLLSELWNMLEDGETPKRALVRLWDSTNKKTTGYGNEVDPTQKEIDILRAKKNLLPHEKKKLKALEKKKLEFKSSKNASSSAK